MNTSNKGKLMEGNCPRYEPDDHDYLYTLKYRKPVMCKNSLKWFRWYKGAHNRRVRVSWFNDIMVSTVFLGRDHSMTRSKEPILFETMVFNDEDGGVEFARCSTWREALKNHQAAKNEMIKNGALK